MRLPYFGRRFLYALRLFAVGWQVSGAIHAEAQRPPDLSGGLPDDETCGTCKWLSLTLTQEPCSTCVATRDPRRTGWQRREKGKKKHDCPA